MSQHILIVEDEADIAAVVRDYLLHAGYTADVVADGREALDRLLAQPPDLAVLDVMLPGLAGTDILRTLRRHSALPVIMLTARVEEVDRLLGLELGADDYLCKPFSPRELVARIKAVLRRGQGCVTGPAAPSPAGLHLDAEAHRATYAGRPLNLTPKEFALLRVLAAQPRRVYSRTQLLQLAYADELDVTDRAIDSHIKNLRRKLGECTPGQEWVRSVYGVGFALEPPAQA